MCKKDDSVLIQKAQQAIWLNRWFSRRIPQEYEELIVLQKCCSPEFFDKYVSQRHLLEKNEVLFIKTYARKNLHIVRQYVKAHKRLYPASIEALLQLQCNYTIRRIAQILPEIVIDVLNTKDKSIIEGIFTYVDKIPSDSMQLVMDFCDMDIFKNFAQNLDHISHFDHCGEIFILQHGTQEMVDWYLFESTRELKEETLIYLFTNDLADFQASIDVEKLFSKCIKENHQYSEKLLKILVDTNRKDLLKEYFQTHGLPESIINYYANRMTFLKDMGLNDAV